MNKTKKNTSKSSEGFSILIPLWLAIVLSLWMSLCQAQQNRVDVWGPNGLTTGTQNPATGSFTIMDSDGMTLGHRDSRGDWSVMELGDKPVERNSFIINKFMQEDNEYRGYDRDE